MLFNHAPTELQLADARASLGVERVVTLPGELASLWDSIPPEGESIGERLSPIRTWVEAESRLGDYLFVQGDFGATYLMVRFAFDRGLVPIYSTTNRDAVEEHAAEGTVVLTHRFRHCRFRRYGV